jgi:parvulin-like peptidyl-prolyl isomerase
VGDVSAPYISQFGIHIVKYVSDIPAGPIEMTEEQRAARLESLLTERQDAKYSEVVDGWMAESVIEYTGIITPYEQLLAGQAPAAEEAAAE